MSFYLSFILCKSGVLTVTIKCYPVIYKNIDAYQKAIIIYMFLKTMLTRDRSLACVHVCACVRACVCLHARQNNPGLWYACRSKVDADLLSSLNEYNSFVNQIDVCSNIQATLYCGILC